MIGPRRRIIGVLSAVHEARQAHSELHLPLNWSRLQRVFAREGIVIQRLPIEGSADVLGFDGTFVVTLNSGAPARQHTRLAAHEYGHIRLHFPEKGEIAKNLSPCRRGDPRELEAELFAALLMLGPQATPEAPAISRIIAALEVADRARRAPAQIPLALQTKVEARPRRRPAKPGLLHGSDTRPAVSHDAMRLEMEDGTVKRFFLPDRGWCLVHDVQFVPKVSGRPTRRLCRVGDRSAQLRYFVFGPDDARFYVFKGPTESRFPSTRMLDRQFALSVPAPPKRARQSSTEMPTTRKS